MKKEGYATNTKILSDERVWLRENRILMVGDAAGLIDPTRGVGMTSAAISGRLAAKEIIQSELKNNKQNTLEIYTKLMKHITKQTIFNQSHDISKFETNEELNTHLKSTYMKLGVKFMWDLVVNKFRRIEKTILLSPSS